MDIKQRYNLLLRKVSVQGGVIDVEDTLETLLNAFLEKYDILRKSYFAQTPAPEMEYVCGRMYNTETTEKRKAAQNESIAMVEEFYRQTTRGRGSARGRGRGSFRGRRDVQQRVEQVKTEML